MATQTLIQYLSPEAGDSVMNRRQVETFVADADIAAGDWVVFSADPTYSPDDMVATVKPGAVATNTLCIGCALHAASAGERVDVVLSGLHPAAKTSARHAVGTRVTVGADAEGVPLPVQASTDPAGPDSQGVVLFQPEVADYADVQPVWVIKRF